jgi:hypothetical protein
MDKLQPPFQRNLNLLALALAKEYRIPAPPPLNRSQALKAELQMRQNGLTPTEYFEAAAQLWRVVREKQRIYPKPYILLSPTVIQLALSNQADRLRNRKEGIHAIQTTLDDWIARYREANPEATLKEAIAWLEWDGVHRQFPTEEYSSWKKEKAPLR